MHEDIIEQKGETTSQMGGSQACYVPWHEIHLSTIMVLMMMVMTAIAPAVIEVARSFFPPSLYLIFGNCGIQLYTTVHRKVHKFAAVWYYLC